MTTRTKILEEGLQTLSEGGLASLTIGRLAEATGLSKSGLFAHFGSRELLEIALLEETVRLARLNIVEPAMRYPEGLPRLFALVGMWFGWSARAGLRGGCPVAAALFELDDTPVSCATTLRWWTPNGGISLRDQVREAIDLGHLDAATDADPARLGMYRHLSRPS